MLELRVRDIDIDIDIDIESIRDICNDPPVSAQVTRLILVPQTSD